MNAHGDVPEPMTAQTVMPQPGAPVRDALRALGRTDDTLRGLFSKLDLDAWRELLALTSPSIWPYLSYRLTQAGVVLLEPAAREMTRASRIARMTELQRRSTLRRLLLSLSARGVECVLLKGAGLAYSLYPDPALRPMSDLDIWVPELAIDNVVAELCRDGFAIPKGGLPDGRLSPSLAQRRLRSHSGVLIELHGTVRSFDVLPRSSAEAIWHRAVPLRIGDVDTRALAPTDALLHACLHTAVTDRFGGSHLGLLDVTLITIGWRERIDWLELSRRAAHDRFAVPLRLAIDIAGVLGADAPAALSSPFDMVPVLSRLRDLALEQVWTPQSHLPSALESVFRSRSVAARVWGLLHRAISGRQVSDPGRAASHSSIGTTVARLGSDLTVKLPAYVKAWTRGDLTTAELRRRGRLARCRADIDALMREAESRRPSDEPATQATDGETGR